MNTFFHLFKYRIKNLTRNTEVFFWTMFFPFILATLFYLGFGNLMDNSDITFAPVKVGVVTLEENTTFTTVLDGLTDMFETQYIEEDEAITLLEKGSIEGIFYVDSEPHITVITNGINETIMKSFLDEYLKQANVISNIAKTDISKLPEALALLNTSASYVTEEKLYESDTNLYTQYFYALLAMSALFGSFLGLQSTSDIQANMTNIGMRREVSSTYKIVAVLSDTLAAFILDAICITLQIFYIVYGLKIDMGDNLLGIIFISIIGSFLGITMGTFVGALLKTSTSTKINILTAISMLCCFISDLMVNGIKYFIEQKAPFINRINPAALITDSMHTLNMYGYCPRLYRDIICMIIIATIFTVASAFTLRRRSYEHI